jgi:prepilin-type N-terminal cleavage/methylation domain-containing protein
MNKKGFTLIELLAVIIILGILMIIAIPAVTNYISESRKESYIDTAKQMINGARNLVNSGKLNVYDEDIAYYIPASCIPTETGGKSPYGEFKLAYVIVTYEGNDFNYYWESTDETGTGINKPVCGNKLDKDYIETSLKVSDIKTNYSIGGRTKARIFSNNCTSYTDVENTLSLEGYLKKQLETDSSLTTDDFGNIRYAGLNNVNNYLQFEDSSKKWRILGIVDGKIKIVDSETYGSYSCTLERYWGTMEKYITSDVDHWHDSNMMTELNGDYYDSLSDLTKNSILEADYGLEGATSTSSSQETYQNERNAIKSGDSSKVWTGKIATIYASDFLYSNSKPISFDTSWISYYGWKFTTNSGGVSSVILPLNRGWIGTDAPSGFKALPTMYLKSGLVIKSGNGTKNNPYVVKLDEYVPCDD